MNCSETFEKYPKSGKNIHRYTKYYWLWLQHHKYIVQIIYLGRQKYNDLHCLTIQVRLEN